jgi:hypothetical protein
MQYMLLIYTEPGSWESFSEEERHAMYEEYFGLSRDLHVKGKLVSSHELQPASTAVSVQVRDGGTVITDGPFAEAKEAIGGYYLIEADSRQEAVEWAERIPSARHGRVEVRPVVERDAEEAVATSGSRTANTTRRNA